MKAAVCTSGVITLRDWPDPAPGPGELLLRVRGCGLCGSDILKVTAAAPDPAVLGHEVVGDVVEVGAGVHRFAAGDRLVVAHHVPCFACHYCRRGSHSMCRHFKRINLDPGGFAELVRVPAPNVEHAAFRLPAAMADETASFTEPLACCLRAVKRARIASGDTALVVGPGIDRLPARPAPDPGRRLGGPRPTTCCPRGGRSAVAWARWCPTTRPPSTRRWPRGQRRARRGLRRDHRGRRGGPARGRRARARRRGAALLRGWRGREPAPVARRALPPRADSRARPTRRRRPSCAEAFELLVTGRVRVDGLISHRLPLGRLGEGVELMRRHEAVKVYVTP